MCILLTSNCILIQLTVTKCNVITCDILVKQFEQNNEKIKK